MYPKNFLYVLELEEFHMLAMMNIFISVYYVIH